MPLSLKCFWKEMSFSSLSLSTFASLFVGCLLLHGSFANAQLRPDFYAESCPHVYNIIGNIIVDELRNDPRIAASILRLHFHDCFVHGCDASILLDNAASFRSEKDSGPNANSVRGYDVIDRMKAEIEQACPQTVSCADVLAISAEISVFLSGGPSWSVLLGRRDSLEAFFDLAADALPSAFFTLDQLKSNFAAVGLNLTTDLVALSGGHTFGRAQCLFILDRLYNYNNTGLPDPTLNSTYREELIKVCPSNRNFNAQTNFDLVTPDVFDKQYYSNLVVGKGLIHSDQALFSTPGADTRSLVELYSSNTTAFFQDFVTSMIRMGNIKPLTGNQGEIRLNCRVVNSQSRSVVSQDGSVSVI